MGYFAGLIFVLAALWLGLSGIYKPLLLILAGISILISVVLASRLETVDREGSPYGRSIPILSYWAWLMIEIFKANWPVIKACVSANLNINPAFVRVKTRCESDLAKTIFANSITLTPGTISVDVTGGEILVHALSREAAKCPNPSQTSVQSIRTQAGAS